jgi:predicted deacylase
MNKTRVKFKNIQKRARAKWFYLFGFLLLIGLGFTLYQFHAVKNKNTSEVIDTMAKNIEPILVGGKVNETPVSDSNILNKEVFGYSTDGKEISGYVIGGGSDTTLMFGSIHGNEMGTADLLNILVKYLKNNPTAIATSQRLVVIPILNPDGYYDRTDKLNANEVNLNLNFGTSDWAMYGSEGQYAGPNAWSEAESRVFRSVVEKYLPNRMISYHSMGSLTNPESLSVSRELAWWYGVESGYSYYADPAWDYSGTATKWFEQTYQKAAITVELNDHYLNDWEINKKPILELLAGSSGLF